MDNYSCFSITYRCGLFWWIIDDTRERDGAAAEGAIGAEVGHPGVGATVGDAFGLGAGALIGDQLQGQETKQADQKRQIGLNQAELTDREGTSKDYKNKVNTSF